MMVRKPIIRTCVASGEKCEKKDLIRIVRTPEATVIIDLKGKANGRGAYLKKDKAIILKAQKSKVLDKKLEIEVPASIYEELIKIVDGQNLK